ncbi:MAG TPA: J domain-containing protein [Rubrobacteraceae bacterium]|nr:J domain-containing protein [Rubrobacteraceae bacterium]
MSIPRRLGRMARGFVSNIQEDERLRESLRETIRTGRERSENLREAFGAAWRGAAEEWRNAEERRAAEEEVGERIAGQERSERRFSPGTFVPRIYPLNVLSAYNRLGLEPGAPLEEVSRKRRELIKKYHPDRFTDPDKRIRAERLSAEINAAHDTIERHMSKS